MANEYLVRDESPISYFTMVPHLVDDSDVSAYAIRLYLHLKRVAGEDGKCWQSQDTLEKACRISNRTIVKAKRELIKAGFIVVTLDSVGGHPQHVITIVDVWKRNENVYRCKTAPDQSAIGVKQHLTSVYNDTSKNTPLSIPNNKKKNTYGEFNNVLLTDEEHRKLEERFNGQLPELVENLSVGIESKGYKYKSHYATILSWARKDGKEGGNGAHRADTGWEKDYGIGKPILGSREDQERERRRGASIGAPLTRRV